MNITAYIFLVLFVQASSITNYILNGGFENPLIDPNTFLGQICDMWTGAFFQLKGSNYNSFNMGFGQYLDMQLSEYQNAYISQNVSLPYNGIYQLSYYQMASSSNFFYYGLQFYWNGLLIQTKIPNTTDITQQFINITAIQGDHNLLIKQIGNDTDFRGCQIDELSLILVQIDLINETNQIVINGTNQIVINGTNQIVINETNQIVINEIQTDQTIENQGKNQQSKYLRQQDIFSLSVLISLPLNQLTSLKYTVMFVDDLWLYYYDKRSYNGTIDVIFKSITDIENLKFEVLGNLIDLEVIREKLPLSDYTAFSRDSFVQVEDSSSVVIDAALPFFLFTIPSNIVYCLLGLLIFSLTRQHKMSMLVRRYYFFKSVLLQSLLEGNLPYFVYLSFSHLSHAFSFTFFDKLSLIFTLLFLIVVLLFSIAFYLMIGKSLKKTSCYFIYCLYRCPSAFKFLTVNNLIRGFLRGSIHFFLHNYYGYQIASLCAVELLVIGITIATEKSKQIFIPKTMFCLHLLYHFVFIALNICLYIQEALKEKGVKIQALLRMEEVVVYSLMCTSIMMMIIDLVPYEYVKIKDNFDEEMDGLGQRIIHTHIQIEQNMNQPQKQNQQNQQNSKYRSRKRMNLKLQKYKKK